MELNQDCVRDLLFWIEENQIVKHSGKIKVLHLSKACTAFEDKYSFDTLSVALAHIREKGWIHLVDANPTQSPRAYKIAGLTAAGQDYLDHVRNDTIWKRLKSALSVGHLSDIAAVVDCVKQFF